MKTLRGEHVAMAAGLALVGFAAVQLNFGVDADAFLWAGVLLFAFGLFRRQLRRVKAGPSGIELAIDQAQDVVEQLQTPAAPGRDYPQLKLILSPGIATGNMPVIIGSETVMQITVVNTGDKPVGVSSLGFGLSDSRYIPVYQELPTVGNRDLPTVLQPQEHATTWTDYDDLQRSLHAEGVRLKTLIAHLADGSTIEHPIPASWQSFGDRPGN